MSDALLVRVDRTSLALNKGTTKEDMMSTFTTADGCELDYHLAGSSSSERTLVLLHGWSQSRAMFDRVIPMLARHYRVVSYDQRGHGESGHPSHGARIARLARDLD